MLDIDECAESSGECHTNAICNNVPGDYTCTCVDGYQGNGFICEPARMYDTVFIFSLRDNVMIDIALYFPTTSVLLCAICHMDAVAEVMQIVVIGRAAMVVSDYDD